MITERHYWALLISTIIFTGLLGSLFLANMLGLMLIIYRVGSERIEKMEG